MSTDIISYDIKALLDAWLQAESNGIQFPVPFDAAWRIAEYSTKGNASRKLPKPLKGKFYIENDKKTGRKGRPGKEIFLSVDCLKHICMSADTEIGFAIRQYMIERDKTLSVVQQIAPEVYTEAQRIKDEKEAEMIKLQIELKQAEAQAAIAQSNLIEKRDAILRVCPEPHAKVALGYQVIEVESEPRTLVYKEDELINDGSTVPQAYLAKRYGFSSARKVKEFFPQLPDEAFDTTMTVREYVQLKREWIPELDKIIGNADRQRWIGE